MQVNNSEARIFPDRPGENIDQWINILEKKPEIILNERQKAEVLTYERKLTEGNEKEKIPGLEPIWRKKIKESEFHLEYFLTPEGKLSLKEKLGISEIPEFQTITDVSQFLYSFDYSNIDVRKIDELIGLSRRFMEEEMYRQFDKYVINPAQSNIETHEANEYQMEWTLADPIDQVNNPHKITVIRNPEVLQEKIEGYRRLKAFYRQEIKNLREKINESHKVNDFEGINTAKAKLAIVKIYKRQVNVLISELYASAVALQKQGQTQGKDYNLDSSFTGLKLFKDRHTVQRLLARFDRFQHGTGGESQPVSQSLEALAKSLDKSNLVNKEEGYKQYKVNAFQLKEWIEIVLKEYDLLSKYSDYDSDREGPADDNKWQVVISNKFKNVSVNSKQKVIKIPESYQGSIAFLNPVGAIPLIDHEVGAHVVQHDNKARMGLAIFEEIGTDRSVVMMEAGAVGLEADTQKKLFSQDRPLNAHYLQAVKAKLEGGSYRECVKAFYDSYLASDPNKNKEKALKTAINRVARLFKYGDDFDSRDPYLVNSVDLVYLEQELVARELKARGKEKYLFLGGVNLQTLAELHQFGLFDESRILIPKEKPSEILQRKGYFKSFGIN
ncbi:hypothetical protein GYA19_01075 [Candidatus Beckwithbacteria bacterium]|nr:hypothetical protein [Candidatus Beckwithbacteria bacterium]